MRILTIIFFLLLASQTLFAQSKAKKVPKNTKEETTEESSHHTKNKSVHDMFTGQDYGMSGCGLGSILFGDNNNRGVQILAGTTNGTYSNNTFGISSGTSNCTPESSPNAAVIKKNMIKFITANRQNLETDVAKNGGETIDSLAHIMNIQNTKEFSSKLQKNYARIFGHTTSDEITNSILEII